MNDLWYNFRNVSLLYKNIDGTVTTCRTSAFLLLDAAGIVDECIRSMTSAIRDCNTSVTIDNDDDDDVSCAVENSKNGSVTTSLCCVLICLVLLALYLDSNIVLMRHVPSLSQFDELLLGLIDDGSSLNHHHTIPH